MGGVYFNLAEKLFTCVFSSVLGKGWQRREKNMPNYMHACVGQTTERGGEINQCNNKSSVSQQTFTTKPEAKREQKIKIKRDHSPVDDADVVEVQTALDHGELCLGGGPRWALVIRADSVRGTEIGHALVRGREFVVSRDAGRASRAGPDVPRPSTEKNKRQGER